MLTATEKQTFEAADWKAIPSSLHPGLCRYFNGGVPTGSFLESCLEGNKEKAKRLADPNNLPHISAIIEWFAMNAPTNSWGSKEKRLAWINAGGIEGIEGDATT